MKFKVGDKVRVITSNARIANFTDRKGKIGVIGKITNCSEPYNVTFDDEKDSYKSYGDDEIELVIEKHKFKVGDRVKVNTSTAKYASLRDRKGKIGTINHFSTIGNANVMIDDEGAHTKSYELTEIDLVTKDKPLLPKDCLPPKKFNIGDVVQVISEGELFYYDKDSSTNYDPRGKLGKIISYAESYFDKNIWCVIVKIRSKNIYFLEKELLIEVSEGKYIIPFKDNPSYPSDSTTINKKYQMLNLNN